MHRANERILATQIDGAIMMLRSAHCRRTDVFRAYSDLITGIRKVVAPVFISANSEAATPNVVSTSRWRERRSVVGLYVERRFRCFP